MIFFFPILEMWYSSLEGSLFQHATKTPWETRQLHIWKLNFLVMRSAVTQKPGPKKCFGGTWGDWTRTPKNLVYFAVYMGLYYQVYRDYMGLYWDYMILIKHYQDPYLNPSMECQPTLFCCRFSPWGSARRPPGQRTSQRKACGNGSCKDIRRGAFPHTN